MTKFEHTFLWNEETPFDERRRLSPYMIETHILHLEQSKIVIERNHRRTIDEINDHIRNLKESLRREVSLCVASTASQPVK